MKRKMSLLQAYNRARPIRLVIRLIIQEIRSEGKPMLFIIRQHLLQKTQYLVPAIGPVLC